MRRNVTQTVWFAVFKVKVTRFDSSKMTMHHIFSKLWKLFTRVSWYADTRLLARESSKSLGYCLQGQACREGLKLYRLFAGAIFCWQLNLWQLDFISLCIIAGQQEKKKKRWMLTAVLSWSHNVNRGHHSMQSSKLCFFSECHHTMIIHDLSVCVSQVLSAFRCVILLDWCIFHCL